MSRPTRKGPVRKYELGGDSRYDENHCEWCGVEEGAYHKGSCKNLEETFKRLGHNSCMTSWEEWLGSPELKAELTHEIARVLNDWYKKREDYGDIRTNPYKLEPSPMYLADAIIKLLGNDKKEE